MTRPKVFCSLAYRAVHTPTIKTLIINVDIRCLHRQQSAARVRKRKSGSQSAVIPRKDGNRILRLKESTVSDSISRPMDRRLCEDQILMFCLGAKLRERLNHLEAVAAGVASTGPSESVTTHRSPSTSTDTIATSPTTSVAANRYASSPSVNTPGESQQFTSQTDNKLSAPALWDPVDYSKLDDPSFGMSLWDPTTGFDAPPNGFLSALNLWGSSTCIDPSFLIRDDDSDGTVGYRTTTIGCGCSTRHIQIRTKGVDPSSFNDIKILTFGFPAGTADPYANNIRIDTVCTVAALHNIGTHLGVNEEILCADESLSPFFRFTANSVDFMVQSNMIKTVQQTFKSLKPDLRPSGQQITVKHHPCIDILPFPTLRDNFITHQDEFDEDELFMDVLTGLVCWGGGGIGKRDRDINTGSASTGTPWDSRSWEAKEWFLKKYWVLLGGEDGELVRQSEWWRGIRGEDMPSIQLPS